MSLDLFTKARLKITFLYFFVGILIVAAAAFFIYADLTAIIANTLAVLQMLLHAGNAVDQNTAATIIAQNIDAQIRQMDLAIGLWLIVVMVLCAYLLAGITLRPVRRSVERQKRFMANISHELRTPLSVMKTAAEATLLAADDLTKEELIATKRDNLEEIDHMAAIIEFLLNFSNLENRASRSAFVTLDLSDITQSAVERMVGRASAKNIKMTLVTEPAPVSGNATALEEIVLNLIKNAIAYTPHGGTITVRVEHRYGSASVCVQDNGSGIDPKDLPNIFEAFYRGDNTAGAHHDGDGSAGLGLAIVREIAELHGAKITVHSALGKGTSITVRFPNRISRWFTPWS